MSFPFDGIRETAGALGLKPDFQSWPSSKADVFRDLIYETKPTVIIEVGSWKGGSAVTMAKILRAQGLTATKIHCVDTWLGSAEHFISKRDYLFPTDAHGHPLLYWQFLLNIVDAQVDDFIVPHPATSTSFAIQSSKKNFLSDLIYIDGAHDYESVYLDLISYVMLLRDQNSVIFGDDFHLDAVRAAVIRFAFEFQFSVQLIKESNHFVCRRKPPVSP